MADGLNNSKSSGSSVGAGIALAALPALGGVASTLLGNKANADAARYATDYDYKKWREYVNEIDPKTQVAKMRAAGINPAIALGQGAIDSGNPSSPQNAANVPNYDFSPIASGISQSAELFQRKQLQDAQISQMDAVTQNQQIRNKTQLMRDVAEWIKLSNDSQLSKSQRDYYAELVKIATKDLDTYDKRVNADIDVKVSQANLNRATAAVQEQTKESVALENAFKKATNPVRAQQVLADVILKAAQTTLLRANANNINQLTPYQMNLLKNQAVHLINEDAATFEQIGINLKSLGITEGHANMGYLSDWFDPILKTLGVAGGLYFGVKGAARPGQAGAAAAGISVPYMYGSGTPSVK